MIHFTKMHGCGNDYIYIDGTKETFENKPDLVKRLSDRHFGVGGDGAIFINRSDKADFEMEMYNADGSRGKMCGNGIRCVAKYVYDNGLTDHNPVTIESFGAVKTIELELLNGKVYRACVDMGEPCFDPAQIPFDEGKADEKTENLTPVSMGNPHAVIFSDDIEGSDPFLTGSEPITHGVFPEGLDLNLIGPRFEHHRAFPEGVNTEFVRVIDRGRIKMRVWERGSGETLACGTGACAAVAASVLKGKTDRKVLVELAGGELEINWNKEDGHIYMTGPCTTVFTGTVEE